MIVYHPKNISELLSISGEGCFDLSGIHLYEREIWVRYSGCLEPFQTDYAIIWEDPDELEDCCHVAHPTPWFMAMAMAGGFLPPIEAYLEDQATIEAYVKEHGSQEGFSWHKHGPAKHPFVEPRPAMTEAIEYIILKDVPAHVRTAQTNRPLIAIVKRAALPVGRAFRDAWQFDHSPEMEAA